MINKPLDRTTNAVTIPEFFNEGQPQLKAAPDGKVVFVYTNEYTSYIAYAMNSVEYKAHYEKNLRGCLEEVSNSKRFHDV